MGKTAAERMADTRRRRAEEGIVQVQVYVHKSRIDELRKEAANMEGPRMRTRLVEVRTWIDPSWVLEFQEVAMGMINPKPAED